MVVIAQNKPMYEYAVLVTSVPEAEVLTIAQWYRDRADAENVFDELKNQWGWTGFTTHDLRRSQLMARIVALVFNWWSLYVRLALPGRTSGGDLQSGRPWFTGLPGKRGTAIRPNLPSRVITERRSQLSEY